MDLVNALKSIFTRNTSAASSGARVPILNSSGEPIGSDTMSNLASVLGAPINGILNSSNDLNNIKSAGYYEVINGNKPLNFPSVVGGNALVEVRNCYDKERIIQTVYDCQSTTSIVTRYYYGSTWSNWLRNDNYGTSSLGELASALGGLNPAPSDMGAHLTETGWMVYGGDFYNIFNGGDGQIVQICFRCFTDGNINGVYCRTFNAANNNWNPWIRLDLH